MALLKNKFKMKEILYALAEKGKAVFRYSTFESGKWGEHYEHEV